jgi:pimeloyl-ACP methyl ester carboxylesterase
MTTDARSGSGEQSGNYPRLITLLRRPAGYCILSLCCLLLGCSDGEPQTRPDIALTDHFLELPNGNRIHYYDEGNPHGKTILFVHGYPTSAYLYRHIIQDLCGAQDTEFRCLAMTHVGFGKSSCPGNGGAVGPLYLVAQMQVFIETMQLDDMALVIHDWGGPIGAAAGMRVADRISHLLVLNTSLTPPWEGSLDWLIDFTRRYISEPTPMLEKVYPFLVRAVMQRLTTVSLSEEALAAYSTPFENEAGKCRTHATLNLFSKARLDGRLFDEIEEGIPQRWAGKPALFVWGNKDPILSIESDPDSFARNQVLLPQAGTRVIDGGNHFLQEDRSENIVFEIRRFLQLASSDPS